VLQMSPGFSRVYEIPRGFSFLGGTSGSLAMAVIGFHP
jgi:hypothetical protein